MSVVAEEKEERAIDAGVEDGAERGAVDIDAGLTTRVVVADESGGGSAEGMAEDSRVVEIEFAGEFGGGIGSVELSEAIEKERRIGGPGGEDAGGAAVPFVGGFFGAEFGIIFGGALEGAAIGEDDGVGAVGRVEADDDVAVAGQVFGERGVVPGFLRASGAEEDDGIGWLAGRDGRIGEAVGMNLGKIASEQADGRGQRVGMGADEGGNVVVEGSGW